MPAQKKIYDLPLGWSRVNSVHVKIKNRYLKSSQTHWLFSAKIPDGTPFDDCIKPEFSSYKKILIRGCNEKIKNVLSRHNFESIPIGCEAVIHLNQNLRAKKSLRKALRYSLKYGSFEKVILNTENHRKLELLKRQTRHAPKPHLKHLFNQNFSSDIECFIWKSKAGEWQAAITVSKMYSEKVQAELLLRKSDADNGALEALIYNIAMYYSKKGLQYLSLGEVPFLFNEKHSFNLKTTTLSFLGRHLRFAYDAPNLFKFKNKFNPVWKTVYLCGYPKISLFALIEMALHSNYITLIYKQLFVKFSEIFFGNRLVKKIFAGRRIEQFKINKAPNGTIGI